MHYYTLRRNADLAVANGGIGNGINIRLGNGTGNFPTGTYIAAERGAPTIASADFNGDGNLDVAICNNVNELRVLNGNGVRQMQSVSLAKFQRTIALSKLGIGSRPPGSGGL